MGWLWSDSKPAHPAADAGSSEEPPPPAHAASEAPPSAPAPPPRKLTRDEEADAELQALLEELNLAAFDEPPPSARSPRSASKPTALPAPASLGPRASSPIAPPRLLPTTMSCRAAFDQAYHCQLPGGQFTHLYRYGQLRNCSPLWSNFWFCMRTNRGYMDDEERARRVRLHYWEREAKYRTGPSSEDVWPVRLDVEHKPFSGDFDEVREVLNGQRGQEEGKQ